MAFLPTDFPSFAWGTAIGGLAAFCSGFLQKAGEHAFAYIKERLNPSPPEPMQVDGRFVPIRFQPGDCAWVNEAKLYDYEQQGYTYYPHPKRDAHCYRITSDGRHPIKEFLLVKPGAVEIADA